MQPTFTVPNGMHRAAPSRRKHPDKVCAQCGKLFYCPGKGLFCSAPCWHAWMRAEHERRIRSDAFDSWSADMAYALGLFYTDGSLNQRANHVLFYNTDRATVDWWHVFVGATTRIYGYGPEDPQNAQTVGNRYIVRRLECFVSATTSRHMVARLIELGAVPRKSWADLHIPEMPDVYLPHFLRGILDGDGSLRVYPNRKSKGGKHISMYITSNSQTFRNDLADLFRARGWRPHFVHIGVGIAGSDAERFCQWIYSAGHPAMARKKAIWDGWVEFRRPFGGLICETNPYATLRGLRPRPWHALVGKLPDTEVASQAGVCHQLVTIVRQKKGLPVCRKIQTAPSPRAWHALVGTLTDREVARRCGVSYTTICVYRKKWGIPRYRKVDQHGA